MDTTLTVNQQMRVIFTVIVGAGWHGNLTEWKFNCNCQNATSWTVSSQSYNLTEKLRIKQFQEIYMGN